jgi:hypothetical protein
MTSLADRFIAFMLAAATTAGICFYLSANARLSAHAEASAPTPSSSEQPATAQFIHVVTSSGMLAYKGKCVGGIKHVAGQIVSWKDEEGREHFTTAPVVVLGSPAKGKGMLNGD